MKHTRTNVFLILDDKESPVGMLSNGITYRLEKCNDEKTMEIMHNGGDALPICIGGSFIHGEDVDTP